MRAAVHGSWCGSRVWSTKCHTCGAEVWFFSCRCGSKVLFDHIGSPWPLHDCDASWGRSLTRRTDSRGNLLVNLGEGMTAMSPSDVDIDIDVQQAAQTAAPSWQPPIVPMDPPPGAHDTIVGTLRELSPTLDPYRAMRIRRTSLSTAAPGPIGKQTVGKITVHAPSPEEEDLIESFTSWAPSVLLDGLRRGTTVSVDLEAVHVLGADCVWFCRSLTVYG